MMQMEELKWGWWRAECLFFDRGKLSDLEFRLYREIPAWFYYKHHKLGGKIRFRRYAILSKA